MRTRPDPDLGAGPQQWYCTYTYNAKLVYLKTIKFVSDSTYTCYKKWRNFASKKSANSAGQKSANINWGFGQSCS
jgi:hypothetical protein